MTKSYSQIHAGHSEKRTVSRGKHTFTHINISLFFFLLICAAPQLLQKTLCCRGNAPQGGRSSPLMRSTQLSTHGVTVSAESKVMLNDACERTHSLHVVDGRRLC